MKGLPKKEKKKKKAKEKMLVVGLQAVACFPKPSRARKAIALLKRQVFKHTRIARENVLLSNKVNEEIWRRGREKPPRKISVKVIEDAGKANVFLQSEKVEEKKKPQEKAGEKEEKGKADKKEEEKTEEEKEQEKKKEEKKALEKASEASAIKRGKA